MRQFLAPIAALSVSLLMPGCGGGQPAGPSFAQRIAQAQAQGNAETRARELIVLAREQAKAQDQIGADATFELAQAACEEVEESGARAAVFTLLGKGQARSGNRLLAERALETASAAILKIELPFARVTAQAALAAAYGVLDPADGKTRLGLTEELLEDLADPTEQIDAWLAIGARYVELQFTDDAVRVAQLAQGRVADVASQRGQARALATIAVALSKAGDAASSQTVLDEAAALAGRIEDPLAHGHALVDVAEQLLALGLKPRAAELLDQAEDVALQVTASDQQRELIERSRGLAIKAQ